MKETPIKIDLLNDFRHIVVDQLARSGYSVDAFETISSIYPKYLTLMQRIIPPTPRNVQISSTLKTKTLAPELLLACNEIQRVAGIGEDLNPYLSTRLQDLEYNDHLMNDWGIHHLHLKTTKSKHHYFNDRTGELLFVWVTENDIYFIDVLDHDGFCDDDLLNILNENWPSLLNRFRINVLDVKQTLTPEERAEARKWSAGVLLES